VAGSFEDRGDKEALDAVALELAKIGKIEGWLPADDSLLKTIAASSTYDQVVRGADEKTFIAFPDAQERQFHVYAKLQELGYRAVQASEQLPQ
jgi:hypothetical protein